jgi:hypothetical protein
MASEKLDRLIENLLKATDAGRLGWQLAVDKDAYMVAFPEYSIQIAQVEDSEDGQSYLTYALSVADSSGNVVDEVRPSDLSFARAYTMMKELHSLARRRATGAEKAVDTILALIEQLP